MSESNDKAVVACIKGDDKLQVLDEALDASGFFEQIEAACRSAKKEPKEFKVAIKPNFMVFLTKEDPSCHTDPDLVHHLIGRLHHRSYTDICVVESRCVLSKWYDNREVATVAAAAGYTGEGYEIADLSTEAVKHTFSGVLGDHFVGRTWKEADYRISFAKNKTHPAARCTLSLKNIFGCTTEENKYYIYHKFKEWDLTTMDMLDSFPVHFGLIDAFISADGAFGFRGDKTPVPTHRILASKDLVALDWLGATMMGLDPMSSALIHKAVGKWGHPSFTIEGDTHPYENWKNTPFYLDKLDDVLEESYCAHSFFTHLIMLQPDPIFTEKHVGFFKKMRKLLGFE